MFKNVYNKKKVFVTGHTGFKGSWLCQWLLDLGAEVGGYSISLPTNPCHFSLLRLQNKISHFEGDIRDLSEMAAALDQFAPDMIFHLAAQPIVSISLENPVDTFATNVMGTVHLLEWLRKQKRAIPTVVITSDKCYENVEWEFGYRETDPVGGKDPYSASKACAEIVFHSFYRSYFANPSNSLPLATGRAGNVIGGGDWAKDRIVPDCVTAWSQGQKPHIRSPHATRPWQHVLEPLSGYLSLGAALTTQQKSAVVGQSFNFGPPADTVATVEELLKETKTHWPSVDWQVTESAFKGKEAGLLKLNCDKALFRLQWKPTLNFSETVQFTAEWYRHFYKSKETSTRQQIKAYTDLAVKRDIAWAKAST